MSKHESRDCASAPQLLRWEQRSMRRGMHEPVTREWYDVSNRRYRAERAGGEGRGDTIGYNAACGVECMMGRR